MLINEIPNEMLNELPNEMLNKMLNGIPNEILNEPPNEMLNKMLYGIPNEIINEIPNEIFMKFPMKCRTPSQRPPTPPPPPPARKEAQRFSFDVERSRSRGRDRTPFEDLMATTRAERGVSLTLKPFRSCWSRSLQWTKLCILFSLQTTVLNPGLARPPLLWLGF